MGEVREQLLQKLCLGMSSKDVSIPEFCASLVAAMVVILDRFHSQYQLEVTKEQYAKYLFLTSRSDHIQPSDLAVDVADQDKKNG